MALSFEQLAMIDELMEEKGWSSKKNRLGTSIKDEAFQLFSLTKTEEQFFLVRNFIQKYFLCTDYYEHCSDIARKITDKFKGENLIIIPVTDGESKIKSGHSVAYEIQCFLEKKEFKEIKILENLESIKEKINEYTIIAVDDFVGSGTQFKKFSVKNTQEFGLKSANIHLYSIAMMERARTRIQPFCNSASACFEFRRALTDDTELNSNLNAHAVYAELEALARVGKNYVKGYLQSEALVTMKKTPNNTLPIFWCSDSASGDPWPALFPRN